MCNRRKVDEEEEDHDDDDAEKDNNQEVDIKMSAISCPLFTRVLTDTYTNTHCQDNMSAVDPKHLTFPKRLQLLSATSPQTLSPAWTDGGVHVVSLESERKTVEVMATGA